MKKFIIILLSVFMQFFLVGCSSAPNPNDALVEKYRTIIDALENEDYISAVNEIYARYEEQKEQAKADLQEIEITMDNFDDYFELVPAFYGQKNDFGEFDDYFSTVGLHIKDSYVDLIVPCDSKITCDLYYTYTKRKCDFNTMTGEISNVRDLDWINSKEEHRTMEYNLDDLSTDYDNITPANTIKSLLMAVTAEEDSGGISSLYAGASYYSFYEMTDISLDRVTGTIYLKK